MKSEKKIKARQSEEIEKISQKYFFLCDSFFIRLHISLDQAIRVSLKVSSTFLLMFEHKSSYSF